MSRPHIHIIETSKKFNKIITKEITILFYTCKFYIFLQLTKVCTKYHKEHDEMTSMFEESIISNIW